MNGFLASLWAEILKIRKSAILWVTLGVSLFAVIMLGFMMFILKDPDFARKYGLIGTKAAILGGQADWPSYYTMLIQITGVLGLLVYGFIASWIFGREYSDHTIKDLLALPVSRSTIVLSKIAAMTLWCAVISSLIFPIWLLEGYLLVLPGWDPSVLGSWISGYALASPMLILLGVPVAFVASFGRGYLAPLGYVILTIALSQVFAILGHGEFVPWAIPLFALASANPGQAQLGAASYVIYTVTVAAGFLGTLAWWRYADQK
ncbi:MAG: bacitracin ABC transporter permease [Spirochaetales bacterium]|nr:MAG: bacitracin ABC transporter permease [Spirochaetales bacterium]